MKYPQWFTEGRIPTAEEYAGYVPMSTELAQWILDEIAVYPIPCWRANVTLLFAAHLRNGGLSEPTTQIALRKIISVLQEVLALHYLEIKAQLSEDNNA